jgi:multisubunit Na+/H+ antiporter MnhG subunit
MGTADVAADVLLVLAVLGAAVCTLGVLAGRTAIDRLHYASAATTVPAVLITAAVLVKEGASMSGINAIVVWLLVLILGSVLTHATARLARARDQRR